MAKGNVEICKAESKGLRGSLAAQLQNPEVPFDDEGYNLLKFHGVYQGYNRDTATERKQQGLDKEYEMMIRVRIPAGRMSAAQYLLFDDIASKFGGDKLRFTTRQTIQYHNIIKGELKSTIAAINHTLYSTEAACGDVVRNVTAPNVPLNDPRYKRFLCDAQLLSDKLLPRSNGYAEIWLDGEKLEDLEGNASVHKGAETDALYGSVYLPRKFKIGFAIPSDNSTDVLTNDLAIIALYEGDILTGYNFFLGGGLGMTHNKPKTYPRLATPVAFIEPQDLLAAATAVVQTHRDFGDRTDRKHARLKYVIAEMGEEWAREQMSGFMGKTLEPARPMPTLQVPDWLGWHEQGDGKWFLGLPVLSGRVADTETIQLRTALKEVALQFAPTYTITANQDVILGDIAPQQKAGIEALLKSYNVTLKDDWSNVRRWSLACPALPTCGLALSEAERVHNPIMLEIENVLERLEMKDETFTVRMTGCPNGCARPYAAEVGLVGRMPEHYALYLGGDFVGTRLNFKVLDKLHERDIAPTLEKLLTRYKEECGGLNFGDYCHRLGAEALTTFLSEAA